MTGIRPCTCSSACRAVSDCDRPPRFQAHLVAARNAEHPPIGKRTEACACHLGVMVVAMTTWARKHELTNADLTILAIEPPARESYPPKRQRNYARTSGLVFSVIRLGEPECGHTDMPLASSETLYRGLSTRLRKIRSDQVHVGPLTVNGNPTPIADAA